MRLLRFVVSLAVGLGCVAGLMLQNAAPATAYGPLVITETFTPTATATATATPDNTATPTPAATPLPAPAATNTAVPVALDPLITKAVNIEQAQTGDIVLFTITITNPHSVAVEGVKVTDPLPSLVDFLDATTGGVGTYLYDPATHTVIFDLHTLAAGQVVVMNIRTRVNHLGQPPETFRNVALASTSGGGAASSNTTSITLIPGIAPGAGLGPGPREVTLMVLALAALALLAAGLIGWVVRHSNSKPLV